MLPAGLDKTDNKSVEIYAKGGKAMAIYKEQIMPFFNLPPYLINVFRREMNNRPRTCNSFGISHIEDENKRLEAYVIADYGRFDNIPDYDGERTHPETYGEKALKHYNITPRELEVLQLIAEGFKVPEIAEKLFISACTAENHTNNIKRKLNLYTPVALTRFAIKHKIVQL